MIKSVRRQLADDIGYLVILANQGGDEPPRPFATYNLSGIGKGVGQEDVSYVSRENALDQQRFEERIMSLSFNCYGENDMKAMEMAESIRKWFVLHGVDYLEELNVAVVEALNIQDRSTNLSDEWNDFKWGLDVRIRYLDVDNREIDYFDTVEWSTRLNTDTKEYPEQTFITKIEKK